MKSSRSILAATVAIIGLVLAPGFGSQVAVSASLGPIRDSGFAAKITCHPSCMGSAGATIRFVASSNAQKPSYTWDLNGDGTFGDATGAAAITSYLQPATYAVSVEVVDLPTKAETQAAVKVEISKGVSQGLPFVSDSFDTQLAGTELKVDSAGFTFPQGAKIVRPMNVAPDSFPNALEALNGGSHLEACMPAGTTAAEVSVTAGIDGAPAPPPGTWARLVAYASNGKVIDVSPDVMIAEEGQRSNIDTPISVSDNQNQISCVGVFVGRGTGSHDTGPRAAIIDDLGSYILVPSFLDQPYVTIDSPADGTVYSSGHPSFASGSISAPRGIQNFCVVSGDASAPPDWAHCAENLTVPGHETIHDGHYSVSMPLLHTGDNTFTAWVRDEDNQIAHQTATITLEAPPPSMYDLSVGGMEITQAVQPYALPDFNTGVSSPVPGISQSFRFGEYGGVELAAGKKTIVRVYPLLGGSVPSGGLTVDARLYAYSQQPDNVFAPLSGSPVSPDGGTLTLTRTATVATERANPAGAFTFTLPPAWTSSGQYLEFVAQLIPAAVSGYVERSTENNVAGLQNVSFQTTNPVTISPVSEFVSSPSRITPPTDPVPLFDGLKAVLPVADGSFSVRPYVASFDVTNSNDAANIFDPDVSLVRTVDDAITEGFCDPGSTCPGQIIGVIPGNGVPTDHSLTIYSPWVPISTAVVEAPRPLTAVAHEFGHLLGRAHASGSCNGGGFLGTGAESWPPDNQGYLQGVGTDPQAAHMSGPGAYRIFYPGLDGHSDPTGNEYDYMSYCVSNNGRTNAALEQVAWVSPRGWTELFNAMTHPGSAGSVSPPTAPSSLRRASVSGDLRVTAVIQGDKAALLSVIPTAMPVPQQSPNVPYQIYVRDAGGKLLGMYPMTETELHADRHPGTYLLATTIPATGAARLDFMDEATLLDSRNRTPAPLVKLVSPKAGTVIGSSGAVDVAWSVTGDQQKQPLETFVRYSSDAGKHYRTVGMAYGERQLSLPAKLFSRSTDGRIELVVNDGFNTVTATSAEIQAKGSPPTAQILSPGSKQRLASNATLYLEGTATSDRGFPLGGKSLTWFVNGVVVGNGRVASTTNLPLGTDTVTLKATDGIGRTSKASLTIQVFDPTKT